MTNSKTLKKTLFSSIAILTLCFVLLIGTTFAWFSDSVSSTTNTIIAGNLDVALEYSSDYTNWNEVNETTNVFTTDVYWEPGYAEVVYLKVTNEGTLDLKYQFSVNVADETEGTNVNDETFNLSDYIMVGQIDNVTAAYADTATAIAAATNATKLSEFNVATTATLTNGEDTYIALVVYMPTDVGNEANYKTGTTAPQISLGIELVATQVENTTAFEDIVD